MEAYFGDCLDYLIDEMCQMNTWVGRIAHRQARIASFAPPFPSPKASVDEDDVDDDDASSSSDDEMTTSKWLALCHSWQKGGVVLVLRVSYLGGELV